MNDDLRKQIYNNMVLKETGDLLSIWQTNDHVEWSETAFEVIQELLIHRLGEIPQQDTPITKHEEPIKNQAKIENPFPVSKSLRISSISLVVLIILFVIISGNNRSNHPILDNLFFLGLGGHLSFIGFVHTYYAWRLNAKEYMKWYRAQHIFRAAREQEMILNFTPWHFWYVLYDWYSWYYLWSNRLGSLFMILVGMGCSGFALFSILSFFLK